MNLLAHSNKTDYEIMYQLMKKSNNKKKELNEFIQNQQKRSV